MRFLSLISSLAFVACQTDKTITTVNSAPDALISSHQDGQTVLEGYAIELRGQASDSNNSFDELQVAWYYGENKICDWEIPDGGGGTSCFIVPDLDSETISLEVRDPDGAGGSDMVFLDVVETENPIATIIHPTQSDIHYANQLITFEGTATDAEDDSDELMVLWNSSIDGDLELPSTPSVNGEFDGAVYLTEGEHYIRLTATDQTGKTDSDNVTIQVGPPNSSPTCSIEEPLSGSAGSQGDLVIFEGLVDDVDIDEDDLSVEWFSDKDGSLGTSNPTSIGEVTFAYSDLSVDTHNITMVVTDELGESCTAATLYTVGTPPSVQIDSPTDGDIISEGELVNFSVSVSDQQDQPDDLSLDWQLNGQSYSTLSATSSGTAEFSASDLAFGTYTLSITATDTDGLTDSEQVSFTINGIPSQPVISITPTNPTTSDDLSVNIDTVSVDPEGVQPIYSYQWLRNNVPESGATSAILSASSTGKNEVWTVQVTPSDGITTGDFTEASVSIENTAPSIGNLGISPNTGVYNDSILTCTATVSDPDETVSPSYEWSVAGSTYSSNPLDLATTNASPNDTITCTVTALDSDGATISDSASVNIENRVPTLSSVIISPSIIYSNSAVSCGYSENDLDGDSLTTTVEWFNGNTNIGSGASLDLTGLVTRNDAIYCEVFTDDGSGLISQASGVMYVTNTAPTAPTVVLSSTNSTGNPVAEEDDLICEVNPIPTDIDGDILNYIFDWTAPSGTIIAGTPTTDTSDILLATTPTVEGVWSCEVSVDDGIASGGSASDSIEVETGCPIEGDGSAIDCPSLDCATILDDGHVQVGDDGLYWIDPDGNGAFEAYCDMTTDDGGWTLIFHQDTSIDENVDGQTGDFSASFGMNLSYSRLPLGADMMFDASQSLIQNDNFLQRTIVNDIAYQGGQTLKEIWSDTIRVFIDDDANTNVSNIFPQGHDCSDPNGVTTPYFNWGQLTCETPVITLMDSSGNNCNSYNFLIGGETSSGSSWDNCAGWPQQAGHVHSSVHFPLVFRVWSR